MGQLFLEHGRGDGGAAAGKTTRAARCPTEYMPEP